MSHLAILKVRLKIFVINWKLYRIYIKKSYIKHICLFILLILNIYNYALINLLYFKIFNCII